MNQPVVASPANDMADYPKPPLRRRRIIERPRLIRALDRSRARVRMLVAGAGYGKTTLAEQWAAHDHRVAWIRARRSSADVAVLARQMAAAGASVVPGADRRLTERLNATKDPADELSILVDLLSEDLAAWPDDAWLAIDDYQYVKESPTAEAFVEGVIDQSPVQVLIATRERPSWVSMRSVLYGEVLEIGQAMLAMSEEEVQDLLAGANEELSTGLLALAGGWPAVVGLASLTSGEAPLPDRRIDLPDQLYEYFAEEVYRSLQPESRVALVVLATAPSLDRELAAELLGSERAERFCAEALGVGVLEEREGRLELHPLAAAFLEQQARRGTAQNINEPIGICLAAYRRRREWDAAFELVDRFGTADDFEALFSDALETLLNEARLATVESWIARANERRLSTATVSVARAEIALREGRHLSAQTIAEAAIVASQGRDAWRAAMVAGRAAHSGSRDESAWEFYSLAERLAESERDTREALWGKLMAASSLELDETHALVSQLERTIAQADQYELVRMADRKLGIDLRFGEMQSLADARRVAELAGSLTDPFVRCSFRSLLAYALCLNALYVEAHDQASLLHEDATTFRIDPALPYAYSHLALSLAGMGRFEDAHVALDTANQASRRCNDEFGLQNGYACRLRVLIEEGRSGEACLIEPPDVQKTLRQMRGEVLASRGLALASVGRYDEAQGLASAASKATKGIETRVLVAAIEAVCALKQRSSQMRESVERLVSVGVDSGAVDLVVTAYRGNAELLEALLSYPETKERTMYIVRRAGDESLLAAGGLDARSLTDPVERLSRREREVYELLCDGLPNAEIAKRLYITEGTVKVHVQHVFDKLGVRSRTALAINAARDRRLRSP
jgi:DNA-binding NarL/FixJ family response regulator